MIEEGWIRQSCPLGQRHEIHLESTQSKNHILLEPDVAEAFPDDKAVNDALRGLLNAAAHGHSAKPAV